MNMLPLRAKLRAAEINVASRAERALMRFPEKLQPRLRALADDHPRLLDLATSFPALFFALTYPRARVDVEPAIAAVIRGDSLKDAAELARVPMWLRGAQPAALRRPIPILPDGLEFRRRIANHIPRRPAIVADWLDAVAFAARWGNEEFALWCARNLVFDRKRYAVRRLKRLALWAWYSRGENAGAHSMIARRFNTEMKLRAALSAANEWHANLELRLSMGDGPVPHTWAAPGTVDGFEFIPLATYQAIRDEALAMNNCLRDYGINVVHEHSRFFSVRREGRRIATLLLTRTPLEPLVTLSEIKGERNECALIEATWAAHKWLHAQGPLLIAAPFPEWGSVPLDRQVWTTLWKPYWLAKKTIPEWLPLSPSTSTLEAL